jgi:carboxypeptidase C (cathepsin A)
MAFAVSGDMLKSSGDYVAGLLERGVRILMYAGVTDLACSWLMNERTSRTVEWSGQEAFIDAEMREWEVNGAKVGKVRTWGPLTFATIYGAGHMVRFRGRTHVDPTDIESGSA